MTDEQPQFEICNVVEAALLAAGRPLSLTDLSQLFEEGERPDAATLRAALEQLSVGERMSDILAALGAGGFVPFVQLFRPEEGRMGVTVTFVAILELMREGLIDIVQAQAYAPLHVRGTGPGRALHVVADNPEPDSAAADRDASATPARDAEEDPP